MIHISYIDMMNIYIHSSPEVNQLLDLFFMSPSFSCSHSTGWVGSVKLEERNTAFFETQVVFWDVWKSLCFFLRVWRVSLQKVSNKNSNLPHWKISPSWLLFLGGRKWHSFTATLVHGILRYPPNANFPGNNRGILKKFPQGGALTSF